MKSPSQDREVRSPVHPELCPQWMAAALGCSEEAGGDLAGEREHADNRFPRRRERNRMSKIGCGGNFGILSSCIQPSSNSLLSRSRALGHLRAGWGGRGRPHLAPPLPDTCFCWISRKVKCPLVGAAGEGWQRFMWPHLWVWTGGHPLGLL